jgi:hypothetical protein
VKSPAQQADVGWTVEVEASGYPDVPDGRYLVVVVDDASTGCRLAVRRGDGKGWGLEHWSAGSATRVLDDGKPLDGWWVDDVSVTAAHPAAPLEPAPRRPRHDDPAPCPACGHRWTEHAVRDRETGYTEWRYRCDCGERRDSDDRLTLADAPWTADLWAAYEALLDEMGGAE